MAMAGFFHDCARRKDVLALGLVLIAAVFIPPVASCLDASASAETVVTAAQVNGTWKSGANTFEVLALGKQKLSVGFSGVYKYKTPDGPTANTGEACGVAIIKGDTAIFKPEEDGNDCTITMKFTGGKLVVEQEGMCPFGFNVSARGIYRKASRQKPKLHK
jgi:hypothetical protein